MTADPVLIVQWVTVALTFVLVAIRVYIRLQFRNRIWSLSDFLVVMAWIFYLGLASMHTAMFKGSWFDRHLWPTLSPDTIITDLKLWFAVLGYYYLPLYCIKGAMLCFYLEFVPPVLQWTGRAIYATGGLCVIGILYTLFINWFWCSPISSNWSLDFEACHAGFPNEVTYSVSTFHIVTDALVWFLPFFVLRHMSILTFSQKLGATVMFGLGFVSLSLAILSWVINTLVIDGKRLADDYRLTFNFFTVEQTTAIVVTCCPAFRAFVKQAAGPTLRRIKSSSSKPGVSTDSSGKNISGDNTQRSKEDGGQSQENIVRTNSAGNGSDVDLERLQGNANEGNKKTGTRSANW